MTEIAMLILLVVVFGGLLGLGSSTGHGSRRSGGRGSSRDISSPYTYPYRISQSLFKAVDDKSGLVISGTVGGMDVQGDRVWVIKLDAESGALIWEFQGPNGRFPYERSLDLVWPDAVIF